jgi:hypothetical protein
MPMLFLGVAVLLMLIWAAYGFARVDPKKIVPVVRTGGGIGALAGATFLASRGQVGLAVPLGLVGLSLLGWIPGAASFTRRTQKATGQVSRVRSAFIEMELDHDTGAMRGTVLQGKHAGVPLEALDIGTLAALAGDIDDESRALLAAYLDRREPGWRDDTQSDAAAGAGRAGGAKMTEQEAYEILGLKPGASAKEIGSAHRALMKKLHPDQGGSTYLAARVNEAKEVLLRRHH